MVKMLQKKHQLRIWSGGAAVIFLPWQLVFFLREFGPITYEPLSDQFMWFLLVTLTTSLILYSLGYFPLQSRQYANCPEVKILDDRYISRRFFRLLYACTALFAVLSFYDYLIMKGAGLSEVVAIRELEHVSGPRNSFVGAVVALLSGAPPLLVVLLLARGDAFGQKNPYLYLYPTIFFAFVAMFLSGGRNSFFIGLLFILSFYCFFLRKRHSAIGKTGSRVWMWFAALAIILGVAYSMELFIERSIYMGVGLDAMVDTFSKNYGLLIYPFNSESDLLSALYAIGVFLTFYATHALNYMSDYFSAAYSPMLYGAYALPQLARLLDVFAGTDIFDHSRASLLVNGAYLTSPGSFYLDFGYAGSIALNGFLSFVFGRYVARGSSLILVKKMVLAYLVVVFIFSPIYCVFGISNGFSIIFLLIVLSLLSIKAIGRKSSSAPVVSFIK